MNRFYKYMKNEYARSMLILGEMRVGTLYEYRHYDDEEIKDALEGRSRTIQKQEGEYIGTSREGLPPFLRGFIEFDEGTPVNIGYNEIHMDLEVPNRDY